MLPHRRTSAQPETTLTRAALQLLLAVFRYGRPISRTQLQHEAGYRTASALDRPLAKLWNANLINTRPDIGLTETGFDLATALQRMLDNPRPTRTVATAARLEANQ